MAHSEDPRTVLLALAASAMVSVAATNCAPTLSLEDRKCPCTADYHCCESIGICRANGVACPDGTGTGGDTSSHDAGSGGTNIGAGGVSSGGDGSVTSGGAGASNAGGAGASTNTGGAAPGGVANSGGAGSSIDAGPPRWRSLDAPGLASYEVRDTCDLELDSNGAPFVAFRSCHACTSTSAVPPVVLKYDGSKWQPLPAQGLPSTTIHAPLVVSSDGAPHLLVDQSVLSFDGARWTERAPTIPAGLTPDRNFEIDASDQFAVTTFNAALAQISVLRFESATWRTLGSALTSNSAGERLTLGGTDLWLAHSNGAGSFPGGTTLVRRFDGLGWPVVQQLNASEFFEFAVTSGGTIYAASQNGSPAPVSVTESSGGTSTEILNTTMLATPDLRVGPDGSLYSASLMDGFVNLSSWDGSKWTDWDNAGLDTASQVPALRIAERSGRIVPYLCFTRGLGLVVMKYE